MKTTQYCLIATTALLLGTGCSNSPQTATTGNEVVTEEKSDGVTCFTGTYKGILPAADCEGIQTELTLNSDSTYRLVTEYLGKSTGPIETNGVYHLQQNYVVELVTPSSGDKTFYKIRDNAVELSDSLGTANEGELADLYILKKR